MRRRAAAAALLLRRRRRIVWVRDLFKRRGEKGEYRSLVKELHEGDDEYFRTYMRMSRETFDRLLRLVEEDITKKDTNFRKSITAPERLALTLRFLGHGDTQRLLSVTYRIGRITVSNIIQRELFGGI